MINIRYLHTTFPVFDLDNIVLRELAESDVQDYLCYMSRSEMGLYITESNRPKDLEEARKEICYWSSLHALHRSFYWGIALKSDNKLIGTAGFNIINLEHHRAEISYDLDPNFWGQGIMLKSINNILKFADCIGIIRVQATVITDNFRSVNLLERCGFSKEGILKKYEIIANEHKDYYMYARVV
ncbi:GNAT family N-acetyltransferase [Rickettsia typhi]|uniref:Ribosomal-protein-alanine N-acetyltransferase n=2 Tax=Rickettsia typhi TaxID=785 RepID=Q68W44_RICTY|nr:GNAT family protein [Rickettsia typhi]AAU04148.1 ribosomal-protein-alanine N-acetyltransferase [Rickettsia typhi str. Wilmington]AFE54525.1 ribosomal-protein-alanine N-acetyltransferase [Rickettsia typhi str. TH1527]AFE55364.1 ribosomal-protein-alanine N-acetyltransferase [Rickettsia typhi str. B9991CWPP]